MELIEELLYYGVEVPLEEAEKIEILSKNARRVKYLDKRTGEIVTVDVVGNVYKKCDTVKAVSLSSYNEASGITEEHFHEIDEVNSFREAGECALSSRRDDSKKLFSRAYASVDTKYGVFTLQMEESYPINRIDSYRQIALYHGRKDDSFVPILNDFDFNKYCFLRMRNTDKDNLNQWDYGYVDVGYDGPDRNIWCFNKVNGSGKENPVFYSCD